MSIDFWMIGVLALLGVGTCVTQFWFVRKVFRRGLGRLEDSVRADLQSGLDQQGRFLADQASEQAKRVEERLDRALQQLSMATHTQLVAVRDALGPLVVQCHEMQTQLTQLGDHATELSQRIAHLEGETRSLILNLDGRLLEQMKGLNDPTSASAGAADPQWKAIQDARLDRLQNDLTFVKTRTNSYLGAGTGLTWLVDETPIYVNTDDFGCPSNFMNGGRYEEEYYQVLASFRRPGSVFLDIGANLGVFSLRLAPLMRRGKVYAFEPNPHMFELFSRSVHLNGLTDRVHPMKMGASDHESVMTLVVPPGHTGGASLVSDDSESLGEKVPVRRLDDVLIDLPQFDLAKLDVEGHELQVLRGMPRLLADSDQAVLLFEKLMPFSGIEKPLLEIFERAGMQIYRIDGLHLVPVDESAFCESQAYFLAARPQRVGQDLHRNFIDIFPEDSHAVHARVVGDTLLAQTQLAPGSVVFHGPYWYLPKGSYRLCVTGDLHSPLKLSLTEKFGYQVANFEAHADRQSFDFVVSNDLSHFELVGTSAAHRVDFAIERMRLTRMG